MQKTQPSWRSWIEPWYLSFAIIGMVVAGLVPVLIPLMVSRTGDAGQVGLVMAAVSLGGLTSPLWGGRRISTACIAPCWRAVCS